MIYLVRNRIRVGQRGGHKLSAVVESIGSVHMVTRGGINYTFFPDKPGATLFTQKELAEETVKVINDTSRRSSIS